MPAPDPAPAGGVAVAASVFGSFGLPYAGGGGGAAALAAGSDAIGLSMSAWGGVAAPADWIAGGHAEFALRLTDPPRVEANTAAEATQEVVEGKRRIHLLLGGGVAAAGDLLREFHGDTDGDPESERRSYVMAQGMVGLAGTPRRVREGFFWGTCGSAAARPCASIRPNARSTRRTRWAERTAGWAGAMRWRTASTSNSSVRSWSIWLPARRHWAAPA